MAERVWCRSRMDKLSICEEEIVVTGDPLAFASTSQAALLLLLIAPSSAAYARKPRTKSLLSNLYQHDLTASFNDPSLGDVQCDDTRAHQSKMHLSSQVLLLILQPRSF